MYISKFTTTKCIDDYYYNYSIVDLQFTMCRDGDLQELYTLVSKYVPPPMNIDTNIKRLLQNEYTKYGYC